MTYKYVKAPPGYTLELPKSLGFKVRYALSLMLITLGIATFTTVAYPLINYQFAFAPSFQKSALVSPITPISANTENMIPSKIQKAEAFDNPTFVDEVVNTSFDYTDASNWFAGSTKPKESGDYAVYNFSIPKLSILGAVVRSDHTDLKQSLIQYPGTALPGNLGNTVIFGHSVLPQFFNPANYLTIFSTLHTLKPGDTVNITADGASYTYKISEMYEAAPDDLSPLAQVYNGRYLTLITCTPPGTYLRRLIIKAYML
ncbi:MAG: sortase [Microgenomates group bacterium]